ncbi:unnamed protein product, partial [Oppiella nova]
KADNVTQYGEQIVDDEIARYALSLILPVGDIMRKAEVEYLPQGLTVPIMLYEDIFTFVRQMLPWVYSQFKAMPVDTAANFLEHHTVIQKFMGEVTGYSHLSKRLALLRSGKRFKMTGTEHNLINRLKDEEKTIYGALDYIKGFWQMEFPRLYSAIGNLPTSELRSKNIQLLLMDMVLLHQAPL